MQRVGVLRRVVGEVLVARVVVVVVVLGGGAGDRGEGGRGAARIGGAAGSWGAAC